jgi:FAD/FMN-containing dehydrogenase
MWSDQDFQTSNPIGRPYPFNITCAPVNYTASEVPTTCTLGIAPIYAVNATSRFHILSTLLFARLNNIRLVTTGTGHDLLGRSDGWGSLELWLNHFRTSIDFQKKYVSENQCTKSNWTGAAIKIDGNYQWRDVYKVAEKNNVIVVGGGAVSPGAIGGWPSGGGHGPATHNYGLGADQILEAEVMLADGRVVTVNACENADLYRSMRGGGPGYAITLSSTVKAYPNVDVVTAHHFALAPLVETANNSKLLDAVATILQALPDMNDAGFAGYAYWFRELPVPFIGTANSGYTHGFWTIGKTQAQAEAAFAPLKAKLAKFNGTLFSSESYATYKDYWSFYHAESGLYDATGDTSLTTSRLIDRPSVTDYNKVRDAVEVLSGKPQEFASNVVLLVSGGQVFKDAADPYSGLHPAWRKSNYAIITGRGITKTTGYLARKAVTDDITNVKGAASKKLAPNTGGYMNEGDSMDPDYRTAFYGSNYASHLATKRKYDPSDIFYCRTCVGAEAFIDRPDGPLCKK